MDKEEKQFEITVDRLIGYTQHVKTSLTRFIAMLETEYDTLDWPTVLESFSVLCGQINNLMRTARDPKQTQPLNNRVVLPLLLSPDRDEELAKLTEGRVLAVNHEMVPDYLRTKPDPDLEEADRLLQTKANNIGHDASIKQINAMDKMISSVISHVKTAQRLDNESDLRNGNKPTYSQSETNELLAAISHGRGIKCTMQVNPNAHADNVTKIPPPQSNQPGQQQRGTTAKAPQLRTNIKSGTTSGQGFF